MEQEKAGGKSPGKDGEAAEEAEEEHSCGYGPWRPRVLQRVSNKKALLAAVSFFAFVQGWVVMGIVNINTTTLERRFDMRSTQVAWITSAYDISSGILGIVLGYASSFLHKGSMISCGALIMGIGSFVMFLPHLMVGNYHLQSAVQEECDVYGNSSMSDCGSGSSLSNYLYVFVAGQLLHAVGGVSAFNIGLTYLDDNVRSKDTPLYVGVLHCFAALGPAIAFIAGGAFLGIYVDIGRVDMDDVTLRPEDPGWVGAWWLGFVVAFVASTLASVIMACFPRELPETKAIKANKKSESYKGSGDQEMSRENFGRSWSDLWVAVKIVVTNPTWIFIAIGATVEMAGVTAFATFLPKILQFQFGLTPGSAALFTGLLAIPGAAGGQLLGGLIPRWLGSRLRGLLIQMTVYSVIGVVSSPVFLIRCSMPTIAGLNAPYFNTSHELSDESLVHPCNVNCSCTTESYEPVCGHDGALYFSPCHAGCTNASQPEDSDTNVYAECTCIPGLNSSVSDDHWVAQDGVCDQNCDLEFAMFCIVFVVIMFVTFMTNTVGHAATIRCVPEKQRGFAYGLQGAFTRFIGSVPAPLLIGLVFDSSCLVWQERCDQTGACWVYDSDTMALRLTLALIVIKGVSSVAFFLAAVLYVPPADDDLILPDLSLDDNVADDVTKDDVTSHKDPVSNRGVKSEGVDAQVCDKTDEELNTRL